MTEAQPERRATIQEKMSRDEIWEVRLVKDAENVPAFGPVRRQACNISLIFTITIFRDSEPVWLDRKYLC